MTVHIAPSDVITAAADMQIAHHNDIGTANADAMDPRNAGVGSLQTNHQRLLEIELVEKSASLVAEVGWQAKEQLAALDAIAAPLDRRTPLEEARDEMEVLRHLAEVNTRPFIETKLRTERRAIEFASARGLELPPDGSFAIDVFPTTIPSASLVCMTIALETLVIGQLLGPFSPGGTAGATGMALLGSLVFTALASVLGIFSLRALNEPDAPIRWLARVTALVCCVAAKLLAMFISAYRLHLKSDEPLSLLSAYHSPEGIMFVLFSMAVFCLSAWKLRGGATLPWTPVFGEATVNRSFYRALDALAGLKEHFRSQCEEIYAGKIEAARESLDGDVTALAVREKSLRGFARRAEVSVRAAETDRIHCQSRLARYQSAYKTAVPGQTFAEANFPPAVFCDFTHDVSTALSEAKRRVQDNRHSYAVHLRQLTEAQAEALAGLEWMFTELEAKASEALMIEEASDAQT